MKKLIAIDGNSLMHRAYYALPAMTTRTGTPTGAVHGFLSMLFKLVQDAPDYLVVAFDLHGPTFRHEFYQEYKAGRKPTPEDLRPQFPLLQQLLAAMGVAVCTCPRFEADDILGTFSRRAEAQGVEVLLVTGDRDALQLVTERTHVLLTKRGITDTDEYDPAFLMEQYGLAPERMTDLKGLMGDSSDHIPGVPGVGEKTALKLLEQFGTLENVLSHAGEVKGKLGEKLQTYQEQARMSYRLGVIDVNAPVELTLSACAFHPERMAGARAQMQELELRSLLGRLPQGEAETAPEAALVQTVAVRDQAALMELALACKAAKSLALDGSQGLRLALEETKQYEISFEGTLLEPGLDPEQALRTLAPALEDESISKLTFDAKSLMHQMARYGVECKGINFDAMIADYLLHATRPAASFQSLCAQRCGDEAACCARLFSLAREMREELEAQGLTQVYQQIEIPLIQTLYSMERDGFLLDIPMLQQLSESYARRIAGLEGQIYELAGETFNIQSTRQLGTVLFETLGLPVQKKTRTGYSTDAEVLEALETLHPIVPLIQEYRFLAKVKSTFLDGLLSLARTGTGRIHTTFHQNVASTGRISSSEPNLQNIPVRTEQGREIRKAFIASPGNLLVGADYSQIELRLLAHMSGDPGLLAAFRGEEDVHARTAAEVFGVPLAKVSKAQRSAAKAVNFGIVYGISDFGLAKQLKISRTEAGDYIKRYFERYPGVHDYMQRMVEEGKRQGYAKTLFGRRRELPELKSSNYNTRSFGERIAMNMPLQGTAADIIKLAMNRVHQALEEQGFAARLVLQIHDELIVDAPEQEAEAVARLLRDIMQSAASLSVPLVADAAVGRSWFDTK